MCMKIIDGKLHHNANLATMKFEGALIFNDVLLLIDQYTLIQQTSMNELM